VRAAAEHEGLSPADRAVLKARQGVELLTSGELRVVDDAGGEVPADGVTLGGDHRPGAMSSWTGTTTTRRATKKAMGDGWFHSGDAAVVHPDGYIEIRDRIKDVIISGGENISSVEVEGALLRHPAVGEAAVVGLAEREVGRDSACVRGAHAGRVGDGGRADRLRQGPARALQAPRGITFVTDLPKTATGKIQKYVLRGGAANLSKQYPRGATPVTPRCPRCPRVRA